MIMLHILLGQAGLAFATMFMGLVVLVISWSLLDSNKDSLSKSLSPEDDADLEKLPKNIRTLTFVRNAALAVVLAGVYGPLLIVVYRVASLILHPAHVSQSPKS
jgi:phage shock protein PspC (stress-responsive transcriptional regulator)